MRAPLRRYLPPGAGAMTAATKRLTSHLRQMLDRGGGALQCFIIESPEEVLALCASAEPLAGAVTAAVAQSLDDILRLPEARHLLCLTCDARFWRAKLPAGFVVLVPDATNSRGGLTCPLCRACCLRADRVAAVRCKLEASISGFRMVPAAAIHKHGRA